MSPPARIVVAEQTPSGRNRIQLALRLLEQLERLSILTLPPKRHPGRGPQAALRLGSALSARPVDQQVTSATPEIAKLIRLMASELISNIPAENGNMYTVTISDDGTFAAEYVVPPALSVPLGSSGSAVDVVRNEDGTYSANGEVITAETMVTAANGNVYRAVLSPEGIPVGVMHVAAMQDVMLGDLGGSVTLTQAEDMSWWYGETAVASGYVHTAANGNMYALTLDAEGMWSAMYQQVEVTVDLGTQGPVTLVRAEDMSWWLGSDAVDVGSEVMSPSGNTYTLWYTDGVWSARFEPESMMIEGTGLVAMTKEDRSGYDVDGADLPASGEGDIDTSLGTYRVTMMDGALMGTRLDKVTIAYDGGAYNRIGDVDPSTDHTGNRNRVALILRDEDDTEDVDEAYTALTLAGDNYTFDDLLGDGVSQTEGTNFVAKAKENLEGIRDQIGAILDALDDAQHQAQVERLWGTADDAEDNRSTNVNGILRTVFGGDADISGEPDADDALEEIGKLITALSSVDGLAAALDDAGVFEDVNEGDMTAAEIYAATDQEATVTYGMVGMTRFGTISRKERGDALEDAEYSYDDPGTTEDDGVGQLGAFAFGVTADTDRHRYIQTTGNALYEGTTLAVDQDGMSYSGDINIRVRFSTKQVDGLITNLEGTDGNPWVYFFDDVESIVLPTGTLSNTTTKWNAPQGSTRASVTFALRAGSARPQPIEAATFHGELLGGNGANAGNQAVGTWSIGTNPGSSTYLAGGFGAERTADEPDRRPEVGDATGTDTVLVTADGMTSLGDGKLKVTVPKYAWERSDGDLDANSTWTWGVADDDDPDTEDFVETNNATRTYEANLTALANKEGAVYSQNGGVYVAMAREMIESERSKLAALIDLGDEFATQAEERWQEIQEILLVYVFAGATSPIGTVADATTPFTGRLPEQVSGAYGDLSDALETVDNIISALSSSNNLEAAPDPDEDGIFVDGDDPFENRPPHEIWAQQDSQVRAAFGSTDYTRFGVWRVRNNRSASHDGWNWAEIETFAYSPLPKAEVTSMNSPSFPRGNTATYEGKTVAFLGGGDLDYEGEVTLTVTWNNTVTTEGAPGYVNEGRQGVGGTLTTVLSNLRDVGTGDYLAHGSAGEVRDLVFPAVNFTTTEPTADTPNHVLDYVSDGFGVSVRYMDRNADRGSATANLHDGVFVGSTTDGPLAVIGRYGFETGFGSAGDLGLNGAFGADRP